MLEQEFTPEQDTTLLLPNQADPADLPEYLNPPSPVDTEMQPVPMDTLPISSELTVQLGDRIPDKEIVDTHDSDATIRARLERARANLTIGAEASSGIDTTIVNDSTTVIRAAKDFEAEQRSEQRKAADLLIAAIEDQLSVNMSQLEIATAAVVAEHNRAIRAVKARQTERENVVASLTEDIVVTENEQAKHEINRDTAAQKIDELLAERTTLLSDRETKMNDLQKAITERYRIQELTEALTVKEEDAIRVQRRQRDLELAFVKDALLKTGQFIVDSDEYKDAVLEFEKNGIAQGLFPQLKECADDLADLKVMKIDARAKFDALNITIARLRNEIEAIDASLSEIPKNISDQHAIFIFESNFVEDDLKRRTKLIVYLTGSLTTIDRNQLDVAAVYPLPEGFVDYHTKTVAMNNAVDIANGVDTLRSWTPPVFNLDTEILRKLSPDNPRAIEDSLERVRTRSQGIQAMDEIHRGTARDIGRTIIKKVSGPFDGLRDRLLNPRPELEYVETE